MNAKKRCCCSKRSKIAVSAGEPSPIKDLFQGKAIPMGEDTFDWSSVDPSQVEDFVLEQDKIPILLALSIYGTPTLQRDNYHLTTLGNIHFNVWVDVETWQVVLGFRGTSVGAEGFGQDLLDDATIAGFIGADACDLTILSSADEAMQDLIGRGFTDFITVGHSLGGTASLCLANKYKEIKRAISFNGGAPPVNPVYFGPGTARAVAYHIVGDLISSHIGPWAAKVARIQKIQGRIVDPKPTKSGPTRQVDNINWLSTWYHDSRRILKEDLKWRYVDVQYEENSLENFVEAGDFGSYLLGRTLGKEFDWVEQMKEIVCSTPIPGAVTTKRCGSDTWLDVLGGIAGGALGGFIGFLVGGPGGAVAGGAIGAGIGSGKSTVVDAVAGGVAGKVGKAGQVAYRAAKGVGLAYDTTKYVGGKLKPKRKRSEYAAKIENVLLPGSGLF